MLKDPTFVSQVDLKYKLKLKKSKRTQSVRLEYIL
jgi:hypothetical protein